MTASWRSAGPARRAREQCRDPRQVRPRSIARSRNGARSSRSIRPAPSSASSTRRPLMPRGGRGSIINISSVIGKLGTEFNFAYSVSKAGRADGHQGGAAVTLAPDDPRQHHRPRRHRHRHAARLAGQRRQERLAAYPMGRAGQMSRSVARGAVSRLRQIDIHHRRRDQGRWRGARRGEAEAAVMTAVLADG